MKDELKKSPCCSLCGASRKPSELNGALLLNGSWDYSKSYCSRIAQCDSDDAESKIDGLLVDFLSSPIPQQAELITVSPEVALVEYRQSFKNENSYLPEVALRYLILLISSDASRSDIKLFTNQMRIELNNQRLKNNVLQFSAGGEL